MYSIGLDIGTTSICAVVIDVKTGDVVRVEARENDTFIKTEKVFEKVQNADDILKISRELINSCLTDNIVSVGISGQMHGILYIDENGNAVSPLYIWQDGRGGEVYKDEQTYAQYLSLKHGRQTASGFGLTTHFYNVCNDLVPSNAVYLCTIADYVGMKLTGNKNPVMHTSNAASLGLFDVRKNEFCCEFADILPEVVNDYLVIGKTDGGISVSIGIGDNQASFIGSVSDMESGVLVNVGTGSQVSVLVDSYKDVNGIEVRPCVDGKYLLAGCALCGGRAFAVLEKFFRDIVNMAGNEDIGSLYPAMDRCLERYLDSSIENGLKFSNKFCGTRENPLERGSILNIGIDNFTPEHFMVGILEGVVSELYEMYQKMNGKATVLVGSGNGIRKNKALQKLFSDMFSLPLVIPRHKEEAAYGAALFSLVSVGYCKSISEAQKLIRYEVQDV